jgi:FAD/FMN-containing dehydrogenase
MHSSRVISAPSEPAKTLSDAPGLRYIKGMSTNVAPVRQDLLDRIRAVVGDKGCLTDASDMAPYLNSWRDGWQGCSPMVVRPASTREVAAVVKLCHEARTPIVPQAGNTGLTGGSTPGMAGNEIVLSVGRMNRVHEVDLLNDTMTVDAGCVLANLQQKAQEVDRLFPLSLGAEGTCQIGGNLSTNAGGINVLKYGNARNLVLGLEVVLPDGQVWNGLRGLRKDNTGYDLKQIFIGAEGTLGIITQAVLKLFPRPKDQQTAFAAVRDPQAAVELLSRARIASGEAVTGFEILQRFGIDLVIRHLPQTPDPLAQRYEWYVLMELSGADTSGGIRTTLEGILADAMEAGLVLDATIAASQAQARAMWKMREDHAEAQKELGLSVKHDVSVPVSRIAEFMDRANAALTKAYPDIKLLGFGHIGDGNIHYNPGWEKAPDIAQKARERDAINRIVHDIVVDLGGSISAEHGLGLLRREEAKHYKSPVEMHLMRTLKRALDPHNLMNPGKLVEI